MKIPSCLARPGQERVEAGSRSFVDLDELRVADELAEGVDPAYGEFVVEQAMQNPVDTLVNVLMGVIDDIEFVTIFLGKDATWTLRSTARNILLAGDKLYAEQAHTEPTKVKRAA